MDKWYYVQGSDRVGPVEYNVLKVLYQKSELNDESFVWKKGFADWMRIKFIPELYELHGLGEAPEKIIEENSPEIKFNFDWSNIGDHDEILFVKIGKDRKSSLKEEVFGPYSIVEIKEAIEEKRINHHSSIFAAGMKGWIEVGETPLNPVRLTINETQYFDGPLFLAIENSPLPHFALVKNMTGQTLNLIGSASFPIGSEVLCTLYQGLEIKGKNIKIKVDEYSAKEQLAHCSLIKIDQSPKELLSQHAN